MLPGFCSKDVTAYVHTKSCAWMFMVALFTTDKVKNNQDVLQWMKGKRNWYMQTGEYYSALKINELSSHEKDIEKQKSITK